MELRERLSGGETEQGWDGFAEVKDRVHLAVISELGPQLYDTGADDGTLRRLLVIDIGNRLAQERGLALADRERLVQEIADDALGDGPIESLLQDASVSEIMVNGPDDVWIERQGRLHKTPIRFNDEHHLRRIINKIV